MCRSKAIFQASKSAIGWLMSTETGGRGSAAASGVAPTPPTAAERLDTVERHIGLMSQSFDGPRVFASNLKKYVAAYSKGLPASAAFRQAALESDDLDQLLRLTREFFGELAKAA